MALLSTSPEECSPAAIDQLTHSFREENGEHIVDGKAAEYSIHEDYTPPGAKQFRFPARKIPIKRGDEGLVVANLELVRREGEAEVRLREGGDFTAKGDGHRGRSSSINVHRDERGFVEINV